MSQVLLSFGIALATVPLLIFTSNAKLMGTREYPLREASAGR